MKLSKAQQRVIDTAHAEIDFARSVDFEKWLLVTICNDDTDVYDLRYKANSEIKRKLKQSYENLKNAVVLTNCSSATLYKLADLGLVEIIKDSKGDRAGIDTVKILNY